MARNLRRYAKTYKVISVKVARWYNRYATLQFGYTAGEDTVYPYEIMMFQNNWSDSKLLMSMRWARCKQIGLISSPDTRGHVPEVLNERSRI
jgi:hypothetical protein